MPADLTVRPVATADERRRCAALMAGSEPWPTLGRSYDASLAVVSDPTREVYWVEQAGEWAGFLVLHMDGPFRGYIQTVCVRDECRGHGVGSALIAWAEERIFGARRLYQRLGYEEIGLLREFLVPGHGEVLLRKSRGPWSSFRARDPADG